MSVVMRWLARRYGGAAQCYEALTRSMEEAGMTAVRARLAGDLRGRILEVGCGTGLNFTHYPAEAEVIALEPLDEFRAFASERATAAPAHITVVEGDAQALPFPDHSFDAAIATLVFCSVPDPSRGLSELRRVLRPRAPVRFFEHVRSERAIGAIVQDIANPLWRWMMDGCNLNRDALTMIRAAGFLVERVQAHDIHPACSPRFPFREIHARV
jgi:ubiquinone/menaquinone biosynthesis C-methylase UbiE